MIGATGEYPEGKLNETDEGELQMAITTDVHGNIRIDFGKPVHWFAMSPLHAKKLGEMLIARANMSLADMRRTSN